MWIKECAGYWAKQNRTGVIACDIPPISAQNQEADCEKYKLNTSNKTEYLSYVDPLLIELENRPEWTSEQEWYDPIVVNECVGSLMIQAEPAPQSCCILDVVLADQDGTTIVRSQPKTPRGRPRKKSNQQCDSPLPPLANSSFEAMNTWNTAKLLGISSTDEANVISGLRKSKRLLIMDEKSE